MRPTIKNPVIHNPWTPDMPNNFCGSQAAARKHEKLVQNSMKAARRSRPVSTKLQLAKIYAEQLCPLYPFLSKTQVKAAIALANNNFHQSRLLLDLSNKFRKVTPLSLALNYQPKKIAKTTRTDDIIPSPPTVLPQNGQTSAISELLKYANKLTPNINRPSIDSVSCDTSSISNCKECINNFTSNLNDPNASTSSYNTGTSSFISDQDETTTVTDNSLSSVYNFNDSKCNPEPIKTWTSHKAMNKIGVCIVRSQKGYKAFLLK